MIRSCTLARSLLLALSLLPGLAMAQTGDTQRLRAAIAQTTLPLADGQMLRFTVSIGIATAEDADASFDVLFGRADKALYLAKQDGRNRVAIAAPVVSEGKGRNE